jgi:uncharacterized membrane protein
MKAFIHKLAMATAACSALMSGYFWLLSAQYQQAAASLPADSKTKAIQVFFALSADMNYYAAAAALASGVLLVLALGLED